MIGNPTIQLFYGYIIGNISTLFYLLRPTYVRTLTLRPTYVSLINQLLVDLSLGTVLSISTHTHTSSLTNPLPLALSLNVRTLLDPTCISVFFPNQSRTYHSLIYLKTRHVHTERIRRVRERIM